MSTTRKAIYHFILLACFLGDALGQRAMAAEEGGRVNDNDEATKLHQELIDASTDGNLHKVKSLLQQHADVNGKIKGTTALIKASFHGHADVVSTLILSGATLSVQDEAGLSALHAATLKAKLDVVKILLQSGADTEQRTTKGSTPLFLSALLGYGNITEVLLSYGAKNNTYNNQGVSALYRAAQMGFYSVIKLLLDAGAKPDEAHLEFEATPLMVAAENSHLKICKELIKNGADLNAQNIYGVSPLHLAVTGPSLISIAKELVASGANVNIKDENEDTPLHWAARFGNFVAVNLLLDSGSDPLMKGKLQQTPADVLCGCELHKGSEGIFQCPKKSCSKQSKTKIKKILDEGNKPLPENGNIQGARRPKKSGEKTKKLPLKPKTEAVASIEPFVKVFSSENSTELVKADLGTLLD